MRALRSVCAADFLCNPTPILMTAVCASTYATGVDTAIMNTLQYIVHLQRIPETETACRGYRKPQMNFAVRRLLSI